MARKNLPPPEFRFPPGKSGNPKGRPPGSKNKKTKMRTSALDTMVRVPVGGVRRRMSLREAIIRYAEDRALMLNDPKLTALLIEADRQLSRAEAQVDYKPALHVIESGWRATFKNIDGIVVLLRLGRLMYRAHPAQRVQLEPEVVTLALSRFEDRRLTRAEQKLVVAFTRTPKKVQWPDWWEKDLRARKCRLPERMLAEEDAYWKRVVTPPPGSAEPASINVFDQRVRMRE